MNENELNVQIPAFEEPVVVEKPKSKKGIWIGAAAALVVIAIVAAIVIGMVTSSPLALLATGFRNSMEAMQEDAFTTLMNQVSNGGSMEFSVDFNSLTLQGNSIPLDGTGSVKIYTDEEAQKTAMTLGIQLAGQKLDASIFGNQESVVIASDWLLGDQAYGFSLKNFVENFNKSVFGSNGAYSLGIELPENLQEQMDGSQAAYAEASKKIVAQLSTRLMKTLEENTTVEKENATLTLGGDTVKTTAVIIKMDHNQLYAVLEDLLEYLRTDEEFKAYVEEYKQILFADAVIGVMDADAYAKEFFQVLDEVAEEMDELKKQMEEEEAALEITFHITKSGKQLVGMEVQMIDNVEPITVNIYAGPDLKNAKEIRFEMSSGDETVQGTYLVKVDDKNTFVALLDLYENQEALLKTDVRWDKQTGAWEITVTDDDDNIFAARGTLEKTDKEISVTLESVETGGEKTELGISAVLRAEDKMPEIPQYKDVFGMTEDEVAAIVNDLAMLVFQLAYGMVL